MLTTPSAYGRGIEAGPGRQIAREMARQWLVRADIKAAARSGTTTAEQAEINQLKAEIKRLRDDNETLKAATVFFARELDPRNRRLSWRLADGGDADRRRPIRR